MTRLFIHGIGTCAIGADEPFGEGTTALEDVPIKGYAKPAVRRRYGRVTRMIYIAAARAIEDAGIEDPSTLCVVSATAMGEVKVSLNLLAQIKETGGSPISPSLVPNSVHNAPAGHLTIGLKNRRPSVTVSQGWLCAEAAIAAAEDLLLSGAGDAALVVIGDEADPAWIDRLEGAGASGWARDLSGQRFQEGGAALVLSLNPSDRFRGSLEARVERGGDERVMEIAGRTPGAEVRLRQGAGASTLAEALPAAAIDGPGSGTSQLGAISVLLERLKDTSCGEFLLIGREVDEIGWLHWAR